MAAPDTSALNESTGRSAVVTSSARHTESRDRESKRQHENRPERAPDSTRPRRDLPPVGPPNILITTPGILTRSINRSTSGDGK